MNPLFCFKFGKQLIRCDITPDKEVRFFAKDICDAIGKPNEGLVLAKLNDIFAGFKYQYGFVEIESDRPYEGYFITKEEALYLAVKSDELWAFLKETVLPQVEAYL